VTAKAKWYRGNADLCRKMAAKAVGDKKAAWLELGQSWTQLLVAEERLDASQAEIALGWLEPRRVPAARSWRRQKARQQLGSRGS